MSVEYLRNLGVLDETNPSRPSVVITNHMISKTNCLSASGPILRCAVLLLAGLGVSLPPYRQEAAFINLMILVSVVVLVVPAAL